MFEHGVSRAGYIEVPRDPYLGLEFLETRWRTVQHYGVEIDGRRYRWSAPAVCRAGESGYRGPARGRWPFQVDPDDVRTIYFRDPEDKSWHVLKWEHAEALRMPLSKEALAFARQLAAAKYQYPDDRLSVADLLERWQIGLGATPSERRMVLRRSREQAAIEVPDLHQGPGDEADADTGGTQELHQFSESGDDDAADFVSEDEFYADALEDV